MASTVFKTLCPETVFDFEHLTGVPEKASC
jgi:hypothetical protein